MSKAGLLVLCFIALIAGLSWVFTAGFPLGYALGVIVLCIGLGVCSLLVGE